MARLTFTPLPDGYFDGQLGGAGEGDKFVKAVNAYLALVSAEFIALEARSGYPELDWADGDPLAISGGTLVLRGRNLLQGQTFDTLRLTEGTAQLDLHPLKPGDSGITVVMLLGVGALAIAYNSTTKVLTITLAAGGSADNAIATAINAAGAQTKGHIRAVSAAGGNFTLAQSSREMTGGVGSYAGNQALVSGVEALPLHATGIAPAATWTDTAVSVTVPDLSSQATPRHAEDQLAVTLKSYGLASLPLPLINPAARAATAPELVHFDTAALLAAGGDVTLKGTNLLQGQTFDTLRITEAAVELDLFALKPGKSGITVEVIAGAGALGVTYDPVTKALVITLAAGGSTCAAVATAINADGAQTDGHVRANLVGAGNFTAAVAATPMTGGLGDYSLNRVLIGGLEALPANEPGDASTAKWADDTIIVTSPAVGAAGEVVAIAAQSNGVRSQQLSCVLT